jgi:hypothetical protein
MILRSQFEAKSDYQILYIKIHADPPLDPTTTYQKKLNDWSVFLDKNYT